MLASDRELLVSSLPFPVARPSNWDIIEAADKEGLFFILSYRNAISVADEIR